MAEILQEWHCYVDLIEQDTVHLVMIDMTDQSDPDAREYGEFPRRHFAHIEDDLVEGLILDVTVTDDEKINISPCSREPQDPDVAAARLAEVLSMVRKLRGDSD